MGKITVRSINNNKIYIYIFILFLIFLGINFSSKFSSPNYYESIIRSQNYRMQVSNNNNGEVHRHEANDEHIQAPQSVVDMTPKRKIYPKRVNMGACPPLFGKVTLFVAVVESSMKTLVSY